MCADGIGAHRATITRPRPPAGAARIEDEITDVVEKAAAEAGIGLALIDRPSSVCRVDAVIGEVRHIRRRK